MDWSEQQDAISDYIAEIIDQRDDLLAALEEIDKAIEEFVWGGKAKNEKGLLFAQDNARAAIAKAKED